MKYTTLTLIPVILALSACASMGPKEIPVAETPTVKFAKPEQDTKIVVLDPDCAALARYARYVAFLRDSGVNLIDVPVLAVDTPPNLAVSVINREVYARPDVSPEIGQKNSYEVCRANTYPAMATALQGAEQKFNEAEAARLKAALAEKRAKTAKKKTP